MNEQYSKIEEELNSLLIACEDNLVLRERINQLIYEHGFVYKKIDFQKYTEENLQRIKAEKEEWVYRQKYEEACYNRIREKEYIRCLALKKAYLAEYGNEKSRFSIVVSDKKYLVYYDFGE